MKRLIAIALFVCATPAAAQVVAATDRGVVVAHDGVVELFDASLRRTWSAEGLDRVTSIVTGAGRVALLDAWGNRARIVRLSDGRGETIATGETPVDGVFHGDELLVLERDSATLSRAGGGSIRLAADPAFLRARGDRIYVYSRTQGVLQEIEVVGRQLRARRTAAVQPFAADMELSGKTLYLLFPRDAKLASIDLDSFSIETTPAGGAPADAAAGRASNAITAPLVWIADPAAKRVWTLEGAQSVGAAFGRGFIRGLIGLGLFRPRGTDFPTGIDRVVSAGDVVAAYDTASATLYRLDGRKVKVIAQDVSPQAFAITGGGVVVWRANRLTWAG